MPHAVKSAGVSLVIVASDKRPFRGCGNVAGAGGVAAVLGKGAVVQNDIGCQGGAGGEVLLSVIFAVDNIVEDFQFLGVGNQNRGCGSTFARQPLGRQGDRLGDRLVKIINFRAVIPFVKGVSRFSRGGRGGAAFWPRMTLCAPTALPPSVAKVTSTLALSLKVILLAILP